MVYNFCGSVADVVHEDLDLDCNEIYVNGEYAV
jgi:hypothetical protein